MDIQIENTYIKQFIIVTGKEIDKAVLFPKGEEKYTALRLAENEVRLKGMNVGLRDEPCPLICSFGVQFLAKWIDINPETWNRIDTIIIPEDGKFGFKNNGAVLITFKEKSNE